MFFSIVVPTYNRSKLLCRCLDSIKNQTFGDYEVLILDDCSSDDTSEVVKKYTSDERFKYIKFEKNHGHGDKVWMKALGKGWFRAEYCMVICDDDRVSSDTFLEKVYECFKKDLGIDCIAVEFSYVYGDIKIIPNEIIDWGDSVFTYSSLARWQQEKLNNTLILAWKTNFLKRQVEIANKNRKKDATFIELSCRFIYSNANKISYILNKYYEFNHSPDARRKYLDYYNWIVSSGMLCADIQDKDEMYQRLKVGYTESGLMLGAFFDWGAEELARALSTFAGNEDFPKILRQFARIYQEQYNKKLMSYYVDFNNSLMSEDERNEAIGRARNIVVYCENSWTSQICDYLKNKGKNILYIADDGKEGYKNYQDILKEKDLIDLVFIASGAPKVIYQIFQKLKPRENNIRVATLIMRDEYK